MEVDWGRDINCVNIRLQKLGFVGASLRIELRSDLAARIHAGAADGNQFSIRCGKDSFRNGASPGDAARANAALSALVLQGRAGAARPPPQHTGGGEPLGVNEPGESFWE